LPTTLFVITVPKANTIDLDACCLSSLAAVAIYSVEGNSWLKVGLLYLDDIHQSILNGERLSGSQITVAISLLKSQWLRRYSFDVS